VDTPPCADVLLVQKRSRSQLLKTARSEATGHMWKRPKKRFRELRKLGVTTRQIKMVVSSRKAHWRLSRTLATNMGKGNEWLAEQGLISLKEQWIKIHYPS
jgi:hypothetical protein